MKVKSDDNKITLTNFPIVQWSFGLVFSSIGLQMVVHNLLLASSGGVWGILFGLVFVFAGYHSGLSAAYEKITIDRWLKTVKIKKIGLLQFSTTEYAADDIENFYSETVTDSDDAKQHTICMTLKSGQPLTLGTAFQSGAECETAIKTARAFLYQPDFSGKHQPSVVESSGRKNFPKRFRRKQS